MCQVSILPRKNDTAISSIPCLVFLAIDTLWLTGCHFNHSESGTNHCHFPGWKGANEVIHSVIGILVTLVSFHWFTVRKINTRMQNFNEKITICFYKFIIIENIALHCVKSKSYSHVIYYRCAGPWLKWYWPGPIWSGQHRLISWRRGNDVWCA